MRETTSLKSLAFNVLERLERNKLRNKTETNVPNLVSRPLSCETNYETKNGVFAKSFLVHPSSLVDEYEERLAIAEYDGHQNLAQAQRIAYQDAFIAVLSTLPYEESHKKDWFDERLQEAKKWLISQGLE